MNNKKLIKMPWNKHWTQSCIKCSLQLKYVPTLSLKIRSDRLSRQRSVYKYISTNHWIASNTTGGYCLKNCQTCSKSHHVYNYIIMLEMSDTFLKHGVVEGDHNLLHCGVTESKQKNAWTWSVTVQLSDFLHSKEQKMYM